MKLGPGSSLGAAGGGGSLISVSLSLPSPLNLLKLLFPQNLLSLFLHWVRYYKEGRI